MSTLVGDPSKARDALGWAPSMAFVDLVAAKVAEDLRIVQGA